MKPETEDDRIENLFGKLRFDDKDRRETEVEGWGIEFEFLGRRRVEGQQRGIAENAIAEEQRTKIREEEREMRFGVSTSGPSK